MVENSANIAVTIAKMLQHKLVPFTWVAINFGFFVFNDGTSCIFHGISVGSHLHFHLSSVKKFMNTKRLNMLQCTSVSTLGADLIFSNENLVAILGISQNVPIRVILHDVLCMLVGQSL